MIFRLKDGSASLFLLLTSKKRKNEEGFLEASWSYTIVHRKRRFNMQNKLKKKKTKNDLQVKCKRLKEAMKEINKEQKSIKDGQSQIQEKLKAIEMECQSLQEETKLMIQQSALTQIRLALMLNIVKARNEGEFTKAAQITQLLREIIARDNMRQQQPKSRKE